MLGNINKAVYNKAFVENEYYNCMGNRIDKVLELFGKNEGGKILDIGCGDGMISGLIGKKTGARIYGVDVAGAALRMARKRGVTTRAFDINKKLPFKTGFFDAVYCGEVLEHVFDVDVLIDEIKRVLKPAGYTVITVPNIAAWYNRGLLVMGYIPFWIEASVKNPVGTPFALGLGHVRAFNKSAIAELFRIHGFRVEKASGAYISPREVENTMAQKIAARIISFVDKLFSHFPTLSTNIVLRASR